MSSKPLSIIAYTPRYLLIAALGWIRWSAARLAVIPLPLVSACLLLLSQSLYYIALLYPGPFADECRSRCRYRIAIAALPGSSQSLCADGSVSGTQSVTRSDLDQTPFNTLGLPCATQQETISGCYGRLEHVVKRWSGRCWGG